MVASESKVPLLSGGLSEQVAVFDICFQELCTLMLICLASMKTLMSEGSCFIPVLDIFLLEYIWARIRSRVASVWGEPWTSQLWM